jgi:flagellar basal-body rod modification protein FlgD
MDTSTITSSKIQADYMKLLVTELQNQNPLEPLDNKEMASQLAQFSQLQQLESMNTSFAKVLQTAERNYATSLIDKEVSFVATTESGDTEVLTGVVNGVYSDADGQTVLSVGGQAVGLENIIAVKNPEIISK